MTEARPVPCGVLLYAGLAAGCLFLAIAYVMLPAWLPDWVISHSASPERVLRASHFAFNGHFEATPALKKILGDEFDDFLLQKLSDSSDAARDAAACIFLFCLRVAEERVNIVHTNEQVTQTRQEQCMDQRKPLNNLFAAEAEDILESRGA